VAVVVARVVEPLQGPVVVRVVVVVETEMLEGREPLDRDMQAEVVVQVMAPQVAAVALVGSVGMGRQILLGHQVALVALE
jgi:hypothetical protein